MTLTLTARVCAEQVEGAWRVVLVGIRKRPVAIPDRFVLGWHSDDPRGVEGQIEIDLEYATRRGWYKQERGLEGLPLGRKA